MYVRWLLVIVKDAVKPRTTFNHRFVHPIPSPVQFEAIDREMNTHDPDVTQQRDSTHT